MFRSPGPSWEIKKKGPLKRRRTGRGPGGSLFNRNSVYLLETFFSFSLPLPHPHPVTADQPTNQVLEHWFFVSSATRTRAKWTQIQDGSLLRKPEAHSCCLDLGSPGLKEVTGPSSCQMPAEGVFPLCAVIICVSTPRPFYNPGFQVY